MVGMLSAIPKTPLYDRLAAEGRLDESDDPEFGTNVIPARMTRAELRDGYIRVMRELYEPTAFFDKVEQLYLHDRFRFGQTCTTYWHRHPWTWLKAQTLFLARSAGLYWLLMRGVQGPAIATRISPPAGPAIARSGPIRPCCSFTWSNAPCITTIGRWPGR